MLEGRNRCGRHLFMTSSNSATPAASPIWSDCWELGGGPKECALLTASMSLRKTRANRMIGIGVSRPLGFMHSAAATTGEIAWPVSRSRTGPKLIAIEGTSSAPSSCPGAMDRPKVDQPPQDPQARNVRQGRPRTAETATAPHKLRKNPTNGQGTAVRQWASSRARTRVSGLQPNVGGRTRKAAYHADD